MQDLVRVGLIGSQFISDIHARSLQQCRAAELTAVCSPTAENVALFASRFGIPHQFTDQKKVMSTRSKRRGRPKAGLSRFTKKRP